MKKIGLLFSLLISTFLLTAQDNGNMEVNFDFKNATETKEIRIPISPDLKQLKFYFSGKIKAGRLKVVILDPNGKKEGTFRLESLTKESSAGSDKGNDIDTDAYSYSIVGDNYSSASGSMNKDISKPMQGQWKVEITATKLIGVLMSKIHQNND